MTTRRAFLQVATAAAAPMALGGLPSLATQGGAQQLVFESSLAPAPFVRRSQSRGMILVPIHHGDVTAAWLRDLKPAWQRGRAGIAGLTTPATLFCLEQLAFAHGRRVVFHAEHVLMPGRRVDHQIHRAPAAFSASALQGAGTRWPQRLADALVDFRVPPGRRPGPSLAALEPALPEGATLLTSWIIA